MSRVSSQCVRHIVSEALALSWEQLVGFNYSYCACFRDEYDTPQQHLWRGRNATMQKDSAVAYEP